METRATPQHVVVINDRSAMVGGASNLSILSAQFLERQGIGVTFFAGDAASEPMPVARTVNVGHRHLMQQTRMSALGRGLYNPAALAGLREIIRRDTPSTIYHVHGWSKILSPSIFQALAPMRERVVLHAHDYFLACPNGGYANFRTGAVCTLTPLSARCLATQCDKRGYHEKFWRTARHLVRGWLFDIGFQPANIVVVHDGMRGYFARAGVNLDRVRTIRNPVTPLLAAPEAPWDKRSFFFIGRLEPEKGFGDAAKAARAAGARLEVIGDGEGRAVLERDFPEVVIHGWQDRDGIRRIVGAARAVVVSSRVPEPFSLAAVEAVASGIPVIMPVEALIGSELADLGCGLTFKSGDIASLSRAMRQMNEDDDLIRRMAASCRRHGASLAPDVESWGGALLALYSDVLSRSDGLRLEHRGARPDATSPTTAPA